MYKRQIHTLPKGYRRIFTMKRYEVDFPLKHPRYVIENVAYKAVSYTHLDVYKRQIS